MNTADKLIMELVIARDEKKRARKEFERVSLNYCCNTDIGQPRCYQRPSIRHDRSAWCEDCQKRQPFWDAWIAASHKASTELRRLLKFGRELMK